MALEPQTALLQSLLFHWSARQMSYALQEGASEQAHYPHSGPYDHRLGYKYLPQFVEALKRRGYAIERQARVSPAMARFIDSSGYAIYDEKTQAGFTLLGQDGVPLFERRFPRRAFGGYDDIPPLVVQSLLFIEDRHLLDASGARRNPAIQWPRFIKAVGGQLAGLFDADYRQGGASTLATQLEKFRHFPDGLTRGIGDKLRQMQAASLRAYLGGTNTVQARREIVATYLDSTPLGSQAGHGEIIGIADGLWVWYGTEIDELREALAREPASETYFDYRAQVYRQLLSLLLAQRRPAHYLAGDPEPLNRLTAQYLRLLNRAGVIDERLRDAALAQPLRFLPQAPPPAPFPLPGRKAADAIRIELLRSLQLPNLASLDQLDLTVYSTIDPGAQLGVSRLLRRLNDRAFVQSLGLVGRDLLQPGQVEGVTYSLVLYERGRDRNRMRVRADSLDDPFDMNSGTKLILGSTAKLRTLITYLNAIAELHHRMQMLTPAALAQASSAASDPLSRWAAGHLATARERSLQSMLEAAMQRRYPADPHEVFFTGGGRHAFHNYHREDDGLNPTVEEAFRHSVNLSFVRLLRDLTRYYIARKGIDAESLLRDPTHPARQVYLARFADREGRYFLSRFHREYQALDADQQLQQISARARAATVPLAVVFRTLRPQADIEALDAFLRQRLGARAPGRAEVETLYQHYAVDRHTLNDRAHLAGVHPLELWLAGYLQQQPQALRREVMRASARQRQEVYGWLFKARKLQGQNLRIRTLLEVDAFEAILQDWRAQGFAFDRLVPSLATALGSSGDRPDALATLMGIILNEGVLLPATDIDTLQFAGGTPYETQLAFRPLAPRRVLRPEVAQTVRQALEGVVETGTGARLRGAYLGANCQLLRVGGKTGTSDAQHKTFGRQLQLIQSRPVDRTASFVFFLGDRFFGTITAYVPGPASGDFRFTSSFVVQLLRALTPELQQLLGVRSAPQLEACAAEAK